MKVALFALIICYFTLFLASFVAASEDVSSYEVDSTLSPTINDEKRDELVKRSSSENIDLEAGYGGALGTIWSPYAPGGCKSEDQAANEIRSLSGFNVIRIYHTDCGQVERLIKYKAPGQKVFLGVYYMNSLDQDLQNMRDQLWHYGHWDDVFAVSIGNEMVNDGKVNPGQVNEYTSRARNYLRSNGYNGPVVAVDTFYAFYQHPELCEYSDIIMVNAHAYFDGGVSSGDAGGWLLAQIQHTWGVCHDRTGQDKRVVISESGWPSRGVTYGNAVASKDDQRRAIDSIKRTCADATFLFTSFNDPWKDPAACGCEQYWGIFSAD